jgi:hypothetical protein
MTDAVRQEHLSQADEIMYSHNDSAPPTPQASEHQLGDQAQQQQQQMQVPPSPNPKQAALAPPGQHVPTGSASSNASQKSQEIPAGNSSSRSNDDVSKAMARASLHD